MIEVTSKSRCAASSSRNGVHTGSSSVADSCRTRSRNVSVFLYARRRAMTPVSGIWMHGAKSAAGVVTYIHGDEVSPSSSARTAMQSGMKVALMAAVELGREAAGLRWVGAGGGRPRGVAAWSSKVGMGWRCREERMARHSASGVEVAGMPSGTACLHL